MIHRLSSLMWKLFGQPDIPPKLKDFNPNMTNSYTGKTRKLRYNEMYFLYLTGQGAEDIAKTYNVTRERVRQCLWKAYRESIRNNERKK